MAFFLAIFTKNSYTLYCMLNYYDLSILVFSFIGILSSFRIFKERKLGKNSKHCSSSCRRVIHSRFSHLFGFNVEQVGLLYYIFSFVFFALNFFFSFPRWIVFVVLSFLLLAFIYHLHLLFVKFFVLRAWCTPCLWSALSSFMITTFSFLSYQYVFGYELFEMHDVLIWVYFFSLVSGIFFSSTYANSFFSFIRDFHITPAEDRKLSILSHGAWFSITFLLLTGIALFFTDTYRDITGASRFWPLAIISFLLLIYEIILNHFLVPKLTHIHFNDPAKETNHKYSFLRKEAFAFTISGLLSWYYLLFFSVFPFYKFSPIMFFIIYIVLILLSVGVALFLEHLFSQDFLLRDIPLNEEG